jgi:hypothetical protein
MLGGFLEYNSMYWGYTSLYPIAILLYGLALVCHWRSVAATSAQPQTPAGAARQAA